MNHSGRLLFAITFILVAISATCALAADPMVFYVAPNGNDAWSGKLAEPNAEGTDGPLATIPAARDAVRAMKAAGPLAAPVSVQLRGGVYYLADPLAFGPEDSGAFATPVTYEAYAGEQPVISGGVPVTDWTQDGGLWAAHVDGVGSGPAPFSAIWVNGEYRHPARIPNEGFLYTDGVAPVTKDPTSGEEVRGPKTAIKFKEGDIQHWQNSEDILVVAFHSWDTTRLRITDIDDENNILVMDRKGGWDFNRWAGPEQRYYVEHVREGLDEPGEWYLDRKTGTLSYWPKEGEVMGETEVIAPMLRQLIVLQGDLAKGGFVNHLHFKGLRLYHTDYSLGPEGQNNGQAAIGVCSAFEATGARFCSLEDCEVAHVSTYGVTFGLGCQDNLIARNHVHDLGAGGVKIGATTEGATSFETARHNVVDNNWIHDGGKIFYPGVGMWIGRSSYNTVSHNEISDFYYTGISVGWSWGYAPSTANHNIIEFNHVHHLGAWLLSDMGGIYTLGLAPGTVIRNNIFHDVFSFAYGGWGIYPDEGSSQLLIENNIVYNVKTGGFHQHYGEDNRVVNNIFAFSHEGQLQRTREEDHRSFFFKRNIVYFNNGRLLSSNWKNERFDLDFNCYWDTALGFVHFSGATLEEWRARGHDLHSIIADPLFENPESFDFRLKSDSPAFGIGFEPIDASLAGLYGDEAWVNAPKQVEREEWALPAPLEQTSLSDDFESTPAGAAPENVTVSGESGKASIRITDETAASGKQCLKITDAAGLDRAWQPHLYYKPFIAKGTARASLDLRVEPGAAIRNEWRTGGQPYSIGPRFFIKGDGALSVGDQQLMTVPLGEWFNVATECTLGNPDAAFTLIVTLPGQEPQRFEGLPFGNSEFRLFQWFGLIADADVDATIYVDNVNIEAK